MKPSTRDAIKEWLQGIAFAVLFLLMLGVAEPLAEYVATGTWPTY